ncbi:UTP--glucose-1-phosphate uridylyltransferase GalU [Candidatus Peregrinibacteria bacterium]|nr:UTP--glucose-1-phosphate uridylyltransferase GalU [Candidatus Peregrinibacteria bacterium]
MKIRKAVFPVGGYGTRFLPVTKAQPKEMLPIVDKPVIQYLVEEAVNAGIEEIVMVTGRGKRAIEDHFDHSFELEYNLVEKGKHDLLAEVRNIEKLARFVYVRQPMPLGDGHAILCAKDVIGNEPFAVLFGDDIIDNDVPAIKQLMDTYEEKESCCIGLEEVPGEDIKNYGVVAGEMKNDRLIHVNNLVEKPSPKDAPSNLGIIGKYVCTPEIFEALESANKSKDGEIRLIDGFIKLMDKQNIYGLKLEGNRYDTGNKFGLIKATIDFALKRKDLGPLVKEYLSTLEKN